MRPHLIIHCDSEGKPFTHIPCEWLWDLAEFLALDRIQASYKYELGAFRVTFEHRGEEAVRQLLEQWEHDHSLEFSGT